MLTNHCSKGLDYMKKVSCIAIAILLPVVFIGCNSKFRAKTFEFPYIKSTVMMNLPINWDYVYSAEENSTIFFGESKEKIQKGEYFGMVQLFNDEKAESLEDLIKFCLSNEDGLKKFDRLNINKNSVIFLNKENKLDSADIVFYYNKIGKYHLNGRFYKNCDTELLKVILKSLKIKNSISKSAQEIIDSYPDNYMEIKPSFKDATNGSEIAYKILPDQWKGTIFKIPSPIESSVKDSEPIVIKRGTLVTINTNKFQTDEITGAIYVYDERYDERNGEGLYYNLDLRVQNGSFLADYDKQWITNDKNKPVIVQIICKYKYAGSISYVMKLQLEN